jgi:hypothetical protein
MSLSSPSECEVSKRASLRDFADVRTANAAALEAAKAARDLLKRSADMQTTLVPDVAVCQQYLEELPRVLTQLQTAMSAPAYMTYIHGTNGLKPMKRLLGKLVFIPIKLKMDVAQLNAAGGDALEFAALCTKRMYSAFLLALVVFIARTGFNIRSMARRMGAAGGGDDGLTPEWAASMFERFDSQLQQARARRPESGGASGL